MKIERGSLYKILVEDSAGSYAEVIYKVVDCYYDHHKGTRDYLISPIKAPHHAHWIGSSELTSFEKLPKKHPAWLLYAK